MTPEATEPSPLRAVWLGRVPFTAALELQLALREAVADGRAPETLLLVEHPPTLTLGRRGKRSDVLWTDAQLDACGVTICETPRGGQVTLHAPGQLVAYPIVRIGYEVRRHVTRMGTAAVQLLEGFGVQGARFGVDPLGVWHTAGKLASIGVHVGRGVTVQGIAINLAVDPRLFGALVSCGLPSVTLANAAPLATALPPIEDAARRYAELFAALGGCTAVFASPDALPWSGSPGSGLLGS
jgi:lipoate-protein ligase B